MTNKLGSSNPNRIPQPVNEKLKQINLDKGGNMKDDLKSDIDNKFLDKYLTFNNAVLTILLIFCFTIMQELKEIKTTQYNNHIEITKDVQHTKDRINKAIQYILKY